MLYIDSDGHVLEPIEAWRSVPEAYRVRITRAEDGRDHLFVGDRELTKYFSLGLLGTPGTRISDYGDPSLSPRLEDAYPGGFDPRVRLADMDAEGIHASALLPTVGTSFWGLDDARAAAALATAYNDWLAGYCAAAPSRLHGAAMVAFQDPALAVRELRRVRAEHGFHIAFLRPNPCMGRSIADPAHEPFWDAAEELEVTVALHEGTSGFIPTLGRERPLDPFVRKAMTHPFEQMLACAQLISTGVMEHHPRLQFVFLESGGGWAPFWIDRLDSQVHSLGAFCPDMRLSPSEYFKRQCWISFEIEERSLPVLAPLIGEDRIVWGSDYPHHDAVFPGTVKALEQTILPLPEPTRERIRGANAAALFRIQA